MTMGQRLDDQGLTMDLIQEMVSGNALQAEDGSWWVMSPHRSWLTLENGQWIPKSSTVRFRPLTKYEYEGERPAYDNPDELKLVIFVRRKIT